jgi:hypothetical protein
MGGDETLGSLMHKYKDTYVSPEQKGNHESHRKEGLSVLMSFLLFLEFLLGKMQLFFQYNNYYFLV